MLGIFPWSFLLLGVPVCVAEKEKPMVLRPGSSPQSPGAWRATRGEVRVALTFLWQDCTLFRASMNTKTWRNFAPFKIMAAPIFVKVKMTGKSAYYEDDDVIWEHLCCKPKPPVVLLSKYAILVRWYGLFRDEIFLYWFSVNDTQSSSWHCHRLKRAHINQILMHIVSHMLGADLKAVSSSLLVKVAEKRILQVLYITDF